MATSVTDATISEHPRREDDIPQLARLVADALRDSVTELRKDDQTRMSQFTATFQGEISAFRRGEEIRLSRLENAIADLKPPQNYTSPTTNFWTFYKKVADEHDKDMVSKYLGDLDTSLLFAGLFSAVATTFIALIVPQLQPNPADLTNVLLLRILEQNTSFSGTDPLAPVSDIPSGAVKAQPILFASLSVTLFVAFVAVLGKQWIHYYTRVTTRGNIVHRGKEHQAKLVGLQKWGLHLVMESLPVTLQFALLLFAIALIVYLWDLDVSVADVVLGITSIGLVFYACIVVAATIWSDCPFQTPLSVLLPKVLSWAKGLMAFARAWLIYWCMQRILSFMVWMQRVRTQDRTAMPPSDLLINGRPILNYTTDYVFHLYYGRMHSNPTFWRRDPLFTSPIPEDITASAGFWLLENSADYSTVTAVAAVFSEFQPQFHHLSTTALIRLRDTYIELLETPEFNRATRLNALQTAVAYYILYRTQLIRSTSNNLEVGVEKLPRDLFRVRHSDKWGGAGLFEYLLHIEDRSEPVTSARFLSYIAPYRFCGGSGYFGSIPEENLRTLNKLIEVLEQSQALNPTTITDCVLCVGAVMGFPLHPEDLIRVDKRYILFPLTLMVELSEDSYYLAQTFKTVVEHTYAIASPGDSSRRHARTALEILLILVRKATLPLFDAAWINGLLNTAAQMGMEDGTFTILLRLSAHRKEEKTVPAVEPVPEYIPLRKIMDNIRTCIEEEGGWQDEAVYGGLIAIMDMARLGLHLLEVELLQTLSKTMERGENKPFRVRKAAYDIVLVARDVWLRSPVFRPTFKDLDIPRQLHSVVIEPGRYDHLRPFLKIIEILSEDEYWHPYLRGATDIWLPLLRREPDHVLRILATVGNFPIPEFDSSEQDLKTFLENLVTDEWLRVPGRPVQDLTVDRLKLLAEVTEQATELVFTDRRRRAVLGAIEQVIPSLERRRDDGYDGPGDDIRGMIDNLLRKLRALRGPRTRQTIYS